MISPLFSRDGQTRTPRVLLIGREEWLWRDRVEAMAETRAAVERRLERELDRLSAEIEAFERQATAEEEPREADLLSELYLKRARLERALADLHAAADGYWAEFLPGAEAACRDLARTVERARLWIC